MGDFKLHAPFEPRGRGSEGAHDNVPVTRRHAFHVLALDRATGGEDRLLRGSAGSRQVSDSTASRHKNRRSTFR